MCYLKLGNDNGDGVIVSDSQDGSVGDGKGTGDKGGEGDGDGDGDSNRSGHGKANDSAKGNCTQWEISS